MKWNKLPGERQNGCCTRHARLGISVSKPVKVGNVDTRNVMGPRIELQVQGPAVSREGSEASEINSSLSHRFKPFYLLPFSCVS